MKRVLLAGSVYMAVFAGWVAMRYLLTGVPAFVFDVTDAPVNGRVALLMVLYSVRHRWVVAAFEGLWIAFLTRKRQAVLRLTFFAALPPAALELWFVYRGSAVLRPYFGVVDFVVRAPLLYVGPALAGAVAAYCVHRVRNKDDNRPARGHITAGGSAT